MHNSIFIVNPSSLELKKNEKILDRNDFLQDWEVGEVLSLGDHLYFLELENESLDRRAIWVFDESKNYITNKISDKLSMLTPTQRKVLKDLRESLVVFLYCENSQENVYDFFRRNLNSFRDIDFVSTGLVENKFAKENVSNELIDIFIRKDFRFFQSFVRDKENILYRDDVYSCHGSIVISDFSVSYLYFNASLSKFIILFETSHTGVLSCIYCSGEGVYSFRSKEEADGLVSKFYSNFLRNSNILRTYLKSEKVLNSAFMRNAHLGHNIWNDLSALYRVSKDDFNGVDEVIFFKGKNYDVYGPAERFFDLSGIKLNYSIKSLSDLESYVYNNNIHLFRPADNRIDKSLSHKILEYSSQFFSINKAPDELTVVIGLRFENRTWLNQVDGIIEVVRYLSTLSHKLTVIVDGHDFVGHTDFEIRSFLENDERSVLMEEIKAFEKISEKIYNFDPNINLVKSIGNDLRESIALINVCDFFIAPWGAGLAKYKWVCNKNGIVFTNTWNLRNKNDLHIYDDKNIRDDLIPSMFLKEDCIEDVTDVDNNLTRVQSSDCFSRLNFNVNINCLKKRSMIF